MKPISISFSTAIFIVFLVLKLTGSISWSWWWVTAPLWLPFLAVCLIVFFVCLFLLLFEKMTNVLDKTFDGEANNNE